MAPLFLFLLFQAGPLTGARDFQARLTADVRRGVEAWQANFPRWQQDAPQQLAQAYALAPMTWLHARTGDRRLLDWARQDIVFMARRQKLVHGFHVSAFIDTYRYLRDAGVLQSEDQQAVEAIIHRTLADQMDFADWGAHNRSVVLATGYYKACQAMPAHPDARKWRAWADSLMSESWQRWSVEDAAMYQSFWLYHMLEGAEASGRMDEFLRSIPARFYFEQYSRLLTPIGLMPDFGDSEWYGLSEWYYAVMTKAASHYRDGRYLDHAIRFYETQATGTLSGSPLLCAGAALRWLDPDVTREPLRLTRSEEVLDDLVGKKIVFRNDRGRDSAYLLLNYRDEGAYGRYTRDHLDQVLAAYEEKPHHGHADENAILHFMDGQTLLLGDGGYRPLDDYFGGWRADVFHNKLVARQGWSMRGGVMDYLLQDKLYRRVETEKLHFARFGLLDYSRTRLKDEQLGYTGDRIVLFVPSTSMAVVVDSVRIERGGHKLFANVWHPENILRRGDGWVVSWPEKINWRTQTWQNSHNRDLLIQFLDRPGKVTGEKRISRRWGQSDAFYEYAWSRWFDGQWLTFVTVLQPHPAGAFRQEMLKAVEAVPSPDRRAMMLRFNVNGKPVVAALKLDRAIGLTNLRGRPQWDWQTGKLDYGPLTTDADFAFVQDADFGFMNATRLDLDGRTLFAMPVSSRIYQGPFPESVAEPRGKLPYYHAPVEQ